KAQTVRYHLVNAMLLNEVQKQHKRIVAQDAQLAEERSRRVDQERRLEALERRLESLAPSKAPRAQ
ncbi:MAG TPA: hypothetical protein VH328_09200, partial [Burkholderiaceae bacterium]|nr:hypothetical protein [Burkholderiaceae bacterium]